MYTPTTSGMNSCLHFLYFFIHTHLHCISRITLLYNFGIHIFLAYYLGAIGGVIGLGVGVWHGHRPVTLALTQSMYTSIMTGIYFSELLVFNYLKGRNFLRKKFLRFLPLFAKNDAI